MNETGCFVAGIGIVLAIAGFLCGLGWSDKYWRNQCVDRSVAHWDVDDRGKSTFVWDYEPKEADDE